MSTLKQIFLSYSSHDAFEASLLQYAIESLLSSEYVSVWTYERDQLKSEKEVASALKKQVRKSVATVFILSPATISGGAGQWVELGYCDAFEVKTFVVLHHLEFNDLKLKDGGVPPLLLASQCNASDKWREVVDGIRSLIKQGVTS